MISLFALLSILVTMSALFSLLSHRVLRLPSTIGTMILSLCAAAALAAGGHAAPALHAAAARLVASIDFNAVVLHGMLAFLLFAGALQLDLSQLARERVPVLALSVAATAISTALVALLFWASLRMIGVSLSVTGALLFGALISPTDPIAILEMLRRAGVPAALEAQLAGESLFNDGVGAVLFLAILGASNGGAVPSLSSFSFLLVVQAGGGIGLGIVLGYVAFRLISAVNSYRVELLLTLALAMGGYALADALRVSAPLEVVAAGLLVSGRAKKFAMSNETRRNVEKFWELIDDILNVVLFLLLGLQLLVLPMTWIHLLAGMIAVPLVLFARLVSVGATVGGLALFRKHAEGTILVLTWGGLRGALAIALALSLPQGAGRERDLLLVATYVVVVFSVVVQGLTIPALLSKLGLRSASSASPSEV